MNDQIILRRLLWLRHGCNPAELYGDDGEMQCHTCGIDFKRSSAESIEAEFTELGVRQMTGVYAALKFLRNLLGLES